MKKQVILFLMTRKGLDTIEALIEYEMFKYIGLVVIGKDKGQYDYSVEIQDLCIKNNINYVIRTRDLLIKQINTFDYAVAIGWRWMIKDVKNLIVLHDSLLPKYRGFAPLVNALLNKEKDIGATALWASDKFDEGDIILQEKVEIVYPIKIDYAIGLISNIYQSIVKKLFLMMNDQNGLPRIAQDEKEATYSVWRDEKDYHIDWSRSSNDILTKVNALGYPYKGAYAMIENKKVRIFGVEETKDVIIENRDYGKVIFNIDEYPVVICGSGLLQIKEAVYEDTQESIFPLKKFRTRFE